MAKAKLILFIVSIILVASSAFAQSRLKVYVVNYPLQYFAQKIGGNFVEVAFPAPPNVDPALWMPNGEIINQYQKADVIFLNGANYGKWVAKVSLPKGKLINTGQRFKDKLLQSSYGAIHRHGPEGDHSHKGIAVTTWLNFQFAIAQAERIEEIFRQKMPEHKEQLSKNFLKIKNELKSLDHNMRTLVSKSPPTLLASHPVYQYLAQAYGFEIHSFFWEPNQYPKKPEWVQLKQVLAKTNAKWMIWEEEPSAKTQEHLKSLGVNSLVFNPCGKVPPLGDFLSIMRQNIESLKKVF